MSMSSSAHLRRTRTANTRYLVGGVGESLHLLDGGSLGLGQVRHDVRQPARPDREALEAADAAAGSPRSGAVEEGLDEPERLTGGLNLSPNRSLHALADRRGVRLVVGGPHRCCDAVDPVSEVAIRRVRPPMIEVRAVTRRVGQRGPARLGLEPPVEVLDKVDQCGWDVGVLARD